jgi:hypothetical protein
VTGDLVVATCVSGDAEEPATERPA